MKVSLVVLTYNGYDLTHQLLMDICKNCRDVHQVVVVNNGSTDGSVASGLRFWESLDVLPLNIETLEENQGFIGGMNYGISKSTGDIIVLISNDVRILSKRFVPEIVQCLEENPKRLAGTSLYIFDTGWNKFGGIVVPYIEGYCMAATKEFWGSVKFDDRYSPSDFEDVDVSHQAVMLGYELYELSRHLVSHIGGKTFGYNSERVKRTIENKKKFALKWGMEMYDEN